MKRVMFVILALLALCLPLAAQGGTDSVAYNGIEFELPQALAAGVLAMRVGGDDPTLEQPGGAVPLHVMFTLLNGVPNAETNTTVGEIHVYRTADFAGYSVPETQLAALTGLVETRPDLTNFTQPTTDNSLNLPYLPGVGAGQIFRAKPQYIETEFLTGVRYLTAFASDVSPFTADRVWYTFQGLSNDGGYYVAVNVPVNASALPAEIPADFDYAAFEQNYTQYLADTAVLLNDAAVEMFAPSPLVLDTLVQSLRLPSAQDIAAGATLGGLEGVWNLVSYGSADAPQAVLEIAPITLEFTPEGIGGNGGCNTYFGGFSFVEDGLTIDGVGSTLMACDPAIMEQETAYFTALGATNGYAVEGDQLLIFYGDGAGEVAPGVLTFTRGV